MPAMCEICKSSLPLTESRCGDCNGLELYSLDEIKAIKDEAYNNGAHNAVEWLEEVYGDGIHGTDAWKEYIGTNPECECEYCTEDEEETN